jgi:NAD(P)-dependent dehydrogenase (short-subunit alcohol dehydrogenase family)
LNDFSDQIAVVTGAASGIGRQLSLDLVHRGARVFAIDINEVPGEVPGSNGQGRLTPVVCDLSDPSSYAELLRQLEADQGRIDLLANIAGVDRPVSMLVGDVQLFQQVMQINFFAPLVGTLTVLPGMVKRRHGYVVNVSSDSIRSPIANAAAYIASKGAITSLTESAALEVKEFGVHVHVLYPGFVYTGMGRDSIARGMRAPPKMVVRTPEQVSALTLRRLGGDRIEINAAPLGVLTPLLKTFAPTIFRRVMRSRAMPIGT